MERVVQLDTEKLKELFRIIDSNLGYNGVTWNIRKIEDYINENKPISAFHNLQELEEKRALCRKTLTEIRQLLTRGGCVLD